MPIYEYRCENGHLFEVMQKITDEPVTQCEVCAAPVARVFHPIAVHFKGSGFYNTDYGTARRQREMDKSASEGSDKHDAGEHAAHPHDDGRLEALERVLDQQVGAAPDGGEGGEQSDVSRGHSSQCRSALTQAPMTVAYSSYQLRL